MAEGKIARIMDGTALARTISEGTARRATDLCGRIGRAPCLAAVLVGDDPASLTYVTMKQRRCESVGIRSLITRLPAASTTAEVVEVIARLSEDPTIDGILLQHPVPAQVDERAAFEAIHPDKDVDGSPCTPSPPWPSTFPGSPPAHPPASCACSTSTASTPRDAMRW